LDMSLVEDSKHRQLPSYKNSFQKEIERGWIKE